MEPRYQKRQYQSFDSSENERCYTSDGEQAEDYTSIYRRSNRAVEAVIRTLVCTKWLQIRWFMDGKRGGRSLRKIPNPKAC